MSRLLSVNVFFAAALTSSVLLVACGAGHGREKEESEERKAAQQADQTHALDPRRAVGETASITGCLQRNGNDFVLRKNDAPVTAAPTGTTGTGDDRDTTYISRPAEAPSYLLHDKNNQLSGYVGKEIRIDGTLADPAVPGSTKDRNLAEIDVARTTVVSDSCSVSAVKN